MIIIIIGGVASLMTLDYIDTKEAEKSAKLYEIMNAKRTMMKIKRRSRLIIGSSLLYFAMITNAYMRGVNN